MKDAKPKLKVVVRNLPPQLTEEQFQQAVQKNLTNVDFWYYCPGVIKEKSSVNARAYLHFTSENGLRQFVESFNGHIFITPKGKEQKAQIEPAPFQIIPKSKQKSDRYDNTIENDPDYLQFLESLSQPQQNLPSAEEQLDKRIAEGNTTEQISPLLQFLMEKKAAKEKQKEQALLMKRERAERRKAEKKAAAKDNSATAEKPKPERKEKREKKPRPEKSAEGQETPRRNGGQNSRNNTNSNWQVRRLEPGAISILKEKTPATQPPTMATPAPEPEPATDTNRGQQRYREKKKVVYAPKKEQPKAQQSSEQES